MKVRLQGVPARTYVEYIEHLDSLIGELRVVASGEQSGVAPVVTQVSEVVERVLTRYASAKDETYLRARDAVAQGAQECDLEVDLPAEAANDAEELADALELADTVCREQRFLTLPANPNVAELRRWIIPEVVRQLRLDNTVNTGG